MKAREISLRESLLLGTAVLVAGGAAFFLLRFVPHARTRPAWVTETAEPGAAASFDADLLRLREERDTVVADLDAARARIESARGAGVPSTGGSSSQGVGAQVSALAARAGLQIETSDVAAATGGAATAARGAAERAAFRFTAFGTYGAIEALVAGLAELQTPVAIRHFDVSRQPGKSGVLLAIEFSDEFSTEIPPERAP